MHWCVFVYARCLTHRVKKHCEKQLSPTDAFVQLFRSTRIFLVVDGVSKQATRLARQHLHTHTEPKWKDIRCTWYYQAHHSKRTLILHCTPATFSRFWKADFTQLFSEGFMLYTHMQKNSRRPVNHLECIKSRDFPFRRHVKPLWYNDRRLKRSSSCCCCCVRL